MKKIFDFDFTLSHLMDLSLSPMKKVQTLFDYLTNFWYTDKDGQLDKERWENVRIGTCEVYLDEDEVLHLDFATRFNLKNASLPQELFQDEGAEDFLKQLLRYQRD